MTRRLRAFRAIVATFACAALLSASWCSNKKNKSGCKEDWSLAFDSISSTPTLPDSLDGCGMKANKTSLVNIIDMIEISVDLAKNGNHSIDSTYFWYWTKNTAYTSGGALRGDTLQDSGPWPLFATS